MIDNLISDQMKEIWINLELYFESYDISNFSKFFLNFSEFFWISNEFLRISGIKNQIF